MLFINFLAWKIFVYSSERLEVFLENYDNWFLRISKLLNYNFNFQQSLKTLYPIVNYEKEDFI